MAEDERAAGHYRADIQGLRAVAVVAVVLYHCGAGFSGGYVGVDVFFVISGFVITQLLLREHRSTSRIDFGSFYARRAKRLLPPLAIMLAVVLPCAILLAAHEAQRATARTGLAAALFNANHFLAYFGLHGGYFSLGSKANPLLHTWSLSVEEQFYLAFPILIVVLLRMGARRASLRPFLLGVGFLTATSFLVSLAVRRGRLDWGPAREVAFYLAPCRAWEFTIGALVAGVALTHREHLKRLRPVASALGAGLVLWACLRFDDSTLFPDLAVVLPVVGTALLIWGGSGNHAITRLLSVRPLRAVGDASYSWYLWHWPLIVFGAAMWPESGSIRIIAGAISFVIAWVSLRLIESPLRALPLIRGRRLIAMSTACVVVPVLAAGVLVVGSHRLADNATVSTELREHLATSAGCDNPVPLDERAATSCVWPVSDAVGEVLLVGDSNAGQFTEAIIAAAHREHLSVRVATLSACPFLRLSGSLEPDRRTVCDRFVDGTLRWITANSPEMVIVANASALYIEGALTWPSSADGSTATSADRANRWQTALIDTLQVVTAAGSRALVVHPVPALSLTWQPRRVAPLRLLLDPDSASSNVSRSSAVRMRAAALDAEEQAAKATGASTLDLIDEFCDATACRARVDGHWRYRDGGHITVQASIDVSSEFSDAIALALS